MAIRCVNCFKKIDDDFELIDGQKHCLECYPLCLKIYHRLSGIREETAKQSFSTYEPEEAPKRSSIVKPSTNSDAESSDEEPTLHIRDRMKAFSQVQPDLSTKKGHDRTKSVPTKQKPTGSGRFNYEVPKCKVCDKTAYVTESIKIEDALYHKNCFRCLQCNSKLTMKGFAQINSNLYCKPHFKQMFHSSGGKYDRAFGTKFTNSTDPKAVVLDGTNTPGSPARSPHVSPKITQTKTIDTAKDSKQSTASIAEKIKNQPKTLPKPSRSQKPKPALATRSKTLPKSPSREIHTIVEDENVGESETETEGEIEPDEGDEAERKSFLTKMNPFSKKKTPDELLSTEKDDEIVRLNGIIAELERERDEVTELEIVKQQELRTRASSVDSKLERFETQIRERDLRIKTLEIRNKELNALLEKHTKDKDEKKDKVGRKIQEQKEIDGAFCSACGHYNTEFDECSNCGIEKCYDHDVCDHQLKTKKLADDFEKDFLTLKIELCNTVDKMHDLEMANMRLRTEQMEILQDLRRLQSSKKGKKKKKKRFSKKKKEDKSGIPLK